jgi:hypothetical protein
MVFEVIETTDAAVEISLLTGTVARHGPRISRWSDRMN